MTGARHAIPTACCRAFDLSHLCIHPPLMNLIPKCLVAAIWSSLIVIPPPVRGAVVTANFNSIADVPVTTASYTATGNTVDSCHQYRREQ